MKNQPDDFVRAFIVMIIALAVMAALLYLFTAGLQGLRNEGF